MYSVVVPFKHNRMEFMEKCFMIPMTTVKPINKLFFNIIEMEMLLIVPLLTFVYAVFSSASPNTARLGI